ncbi:DUF485 domain-containing protein [Pseudonocardia sp. ICBG1034]|uniref:DUF485 domain-containing protein n=1 Tax=Pseudonocardia sp. ICBG1034 TaxID=2844381 RepID=UPI001CCC1A70|nr:DUF485 domain-containing protein [Pseudonocardia sp. ICBG1034]
MEPSSVVEGRPEAAEPDWSAIANTPAFRRYRRARWRVALACLVPFALFFFALPVLTGTTRLLSGSAWGSVTWAYLWAFALFVVGWVVSAIYGRRAAALDALAVQAVREAGEQR